MRLINLLIIFIVALIFGARGEPTTENNVTGENENVTSTESCNESTIEEPESLFKENPEPSDSKTTLPESEPQEGSEDLVDKEKSQNKNASTEVPGTERTLTESEPQEGNENLDEKEQSLDNNNSAKVAETENTTQEGPDNLVNEKESLNKNSSTETPSTESTSTEVAPEEGTENLVGKDQFLNNNSFIEVPETEGSLVVSYYNEARGRNAIGPFSKIQLHKLPIPTKSPRRAHHLRRTMIKIFEGLEKGLKKILDPESDEESAETLPESEPQEGSEVLVDKKKNQNINTSTEVPGTERTLTESEPQEGSEKLDEKEQSLDNSSTKVAETENTTNSEPQQGSDNLDDEEKSLNNNSSTETPSTESALTDSEAQKGTEDLDDKDQSLNNNSFIEVPETEGSLVVSYYNEARGRNGIGPFSKIQLHKLPIPTKSPRRAHHLRRTMIKIVEGLEKGLKKILDPESGSVETLPESETQEGSEDLVDREKSQNINTSTEGLGTERTMIKILGGLKKGLKKILDPESDEESVETS